MKVLHIGKFYPPVSGGMETFLFGLTERLNKNGIRSDVLCSNDKNLYEEDRRDGYTVYRLPSLGTVFSTSVNPRMMSSLSALWARYDIIHIHLPNPMANLAVFLTRPKARIILHWHSDIVRQKRLLKIYEPLQNWLLTRADAVIATSPNYVRSSKYLTKHKDKVAIIPLGIDAERLAEDPKRVEELRNRYRGKKIVFSLGRLIYYKGFHNLVESAKYLPDDYVIIIGGDGPLRDDLQQQIARDNLKSKVFLIGKIDNNDVGSYFAASDVFCLSSIAEAEAFGIVQIEAMSFGKPIVATKIAGSGVDWVNADGVTGLNVPAKDPWAMARAIVRICNDRELCGAFSINCIRRFGELFTIDRVVESVSGLYESILKKGMAI